MKRMMIINILAGIIFILGSVPVYAVDQSICSSDSEIILNDDGTLQTCNLKSDYSTNGIKCQQDLSISFYDNGALLSCILSETTTVGDTKCESGGTISFYPDGNLNTCTKASE